MGVSEKNCNIDEENPRIREPQALLFPSYSLAPSS